MRTGSAREERAPRSRRRPPGHEEHVVGAVVAEQGAVTLAGEATSAGRSMSRATRTARHTTLAFAVKGTEATTAGSKRAKATIAAPRNARPGGRSRHPSAGAICATPLAAAARCRSARTRSSWRVRHASPAGTTGRAGDAHDRLDRSVERRPGRCAQRRAHRRCVEEQAERHHRRAPPAPPAYAARSSRQASSSTHAGADEEDHRAPAPAGCGTQPTGKLDGDEVLPPQHRARRPARRAPQAGLGKAAPRREGTARQDAEHAATARRRARGHSTSPSSAATTHARRCRRRRAVATTTSGAKAPGAIDGPGHRHRGERPPAIARRTPVPGRCAARAGDRAGGRRGPALDRHVDRAAHEVGSPQREARRDRRGCRRVSTVSAR